MKKYILLLVILISLSLSFFYVSSRYKQESRFNNFNFYTVTQKQNVDIDKNLILSGQTRTFEFKSSYENLGSVEILIDNHSRINKDEILFKVKEKDSKEWFYQNRYQTSVMDSGQYYPFGFEVIKESENRIYVVQIESINGTANDSISISNLSSNINIKHLYNREYLSKNLIKIPEYLSLKYIEFVNLFSLIDYIKLAGMLLIPLGIIIFLSDAKFGKFLKHFNFEYNIKLNKGLFLILSLYFLTHIQFLNYSQYWDSEWYWQLLISAVSNVIHYKGSVQGLVEIILNNYNFLGHPSMGYVLLLSLGQMIDLGNVVLLNITNTILGIFTIIGFYYFISLLFPKKEFGNLIAAGIFAFNPLFYATSISLNLDFALLVFLTLSVTALFYRRYNLFFIFSLFLIFSKETGLLIFMSIVVSSLFLKLKKFKKYISVFIAPIAIFIFYLYLGSWNLWNSNAITNQGNGLSISFSNEKMFSFGLNMENILLRLFHIFIMNFNWIMTPFVLLGLFKIKNKNFWYLIFIFIPFLLFNLFYTVMPFARYTVASVFMLLSLFYISVNSLIKNKRVVNSILILTFSLISIQVFVPIDPSPIILYGKNYIGSNISSPIFGFRDGLVYNSNFYFVDELSRMINRRSNKSDGIVLDVGAVYFFKNIDLIGTVDEIDKISKEHRNLEYIFVPWFGDIDRSVKMINKYYDIGFKERIMYNGYFVDIYNLDQN